MMFKPKPAAAIGDALCVLKANPKQIPVTPRVVMSLWEGVRELYRQELLVPRLTELTIQFRHATLEEVQRRLLVLQPYIDSADYPEGVRFASIEPQPPKTLGEYITYRDGYVRTLPQVVLDVDESIELSMRGLMTLERRNRNVYAIMTDRLYHEMSDIISLSEVLLNEGYHEETCLLTNCFSRLFKKRG